MSIAGFYVYQVVFSDFECPDTVLLLSTERKTREQLMSDIADACSCAYDEPRARINNYDLSHCARSESFMFALRAKGYRMLKFDMELVVVGYDAPFSKDRPPDSWQHSRVRESTLAATKYVVDKVRSRFDVPKAEDYDDESC